MHLFKLVEDAVLTRFSRILQRTGQALHRVSQRKKPALLVTSSIERNGMANHGLAAEPVHRRSKCLVEIKSAPEALIFCRRAIDARSEYNPLHDICGCKTVDFRRKHDVVRPVNF